MNEPSAVDQLKAIGRLAQEIDAEYTRRLNRFAREVNARVSALRANKATARRQQG